MTNNGVLVRKADGVAWLTLNRPSVGNALDQHAADQLGEAIRAIDSDADCHVVVLSANGKLFCAGGDVRGMAVAGDEVGGFLEALAGSLHDTMLFMRESRLIFIVAIDGAAAGGGLGIVLNADLVVAGPRARFLAAYDAIGLTPDCGVSRLLPEIIGPRRAMELAVTGRVLSAQEALDWGLVNEVVDSDVVEPRASTIAEALANRAPHALGPTKKLLLSGSSSYGGHLNDELRMLSEMSRHDRSRELVREFAQPSA